MNRYVALLRGINVGGNSKIEMKTLKALVEKLGFQQVSTYINSGNVLFISDLDPKVIREMLESEIKVHFGIMLSVMIRDAQNIDELCTAFPKSWTNDDDQKTDILFLSEDYDHPEILNLISHDPRIDTLIYVKGAIGWNVSRSDYPKSGMHKFIGTPVYKNMTARNINTLRKLNDLLKVMK